MYICYEFVFPKSQHMKKALLFIVLAAVTLSVYSQGSVWIDQGATWHYEWSGTLPAYDMIGYVKDTTINGQVCQDLQVSRYMFAPLELGGELLSTDISHRYTYSNGDTVFYLVNGNFHILYNMGAQVGDTWNLGVDTNVYQCGQSIVEVLSTGSSEINGQSYEWINVATLPGSSVGLSGKIYKRFGAVDDYLFPTESNCDSAIIEWYDYNFTCFEDNSFALYNTIGKDCDYLMNVGIEEYESPERLLTIYPNPATIVVNVVAVKNGLSIKDIQIKDMQGRLLKQTTQTKIDVSNLPDGIYLLSIEFQNGKRVVERFVKE